MNRPIVDTDETVLLVGGGECGGAALEAALGRARTVVAADGGADRVLALGRLPDAVIGDMDSLSDAALARIPEDRIHRISDQDSTDFDKCLRNLRAPLVLCHGFLGARLDHSLAVLTVMARRPGQACLLVGSEDCVTLAPPDLTLDLAPGTRVSLYPLGPVSGRSEGLRWPIDGLSFAPDAVVGTSNEATGPVRLRLDAPRMLIILPASESAVLEAGLAGRSASWPSPA